MFHIGACSVSRSVSSSCLSPLALRVLIVEERRGTLAAPQIISVWSVITCSSLSSHPITEHPHSPHLKQSLQPSRWGQKAQLNETCQCFNGVCLPVNVSYDFICVLAFQVSRMTHSSPEMKLLSPKCRKQLVLSCVWAHDSVSWQYPSLHYFW